MLIPDGGIKEARSWLPCTGERKSPRESEHPLAVAALLLFRALPDHAGKAFQRHQRLAGIGPFLQFLDREVIERLPVPGPARRRIDLEADLAAQALTGGDPNSFWCLCHLFFRLIIARSKAT